MELDQVEKEKRKSSIVMEQAVQLRVKQHLIKRQVGEEVSRVIKEEGLTLQRSGRRGELNVNLSLKYKNEDISSEQLT